MGLDATALEQLEKSAATPGDARRLWARVQALAATGLGGRIDRDAMELACHALQLPIGRGTFVRISLKDRAAQAAEFLADLDVPSTDEGRVDRAAALLRDMPRPAPASEQARLLADAVNLDEFGLTGLFGLAASAGPARVLQSWDKQEQYGYWEARLKTQFHFPPVRELARKRLEKARKVVKMLAEEMEQA